MINAIQREIPDDPQPGDFVLSTITGYRGAFIRAGQAILGNSTIFCHAALVVDHEGLTVEAQPGGVTYSHLALLKKESTYYHSAYYLTDDQRYVISEAGHNMLGTPYSYMMYGAIGLSYRLGWKRRGLQRYMARADRMMCSQLIDHAYAVGGVHIMNDGRAKGDITPGELFEYAVNRDLEKINVLDLAGS